MTAKKDDQGHPICKEWCDRRYGFACPDPCRRGKRHHYCDILITATEACGLDHPRADHSGPFYAYVTSSTPRSADFVATETYDGPYDGGGEWCEECGDEEETWDEAEQAEEEESWEWHEEPAEEDPTWAWHGHHTAHHHAAHSARSAWTPQYRHPPPPSATQWHVDPGHHSWYEPPSKRARGVPKPPPGKPPASISGSSSNQPRDPPPGVRHARGYWVRRPHAGAGSASSSVDIPPMASPNTKCQRASCSYQRAPWHNTHCCVRCAENTGHGKKCAKLAFDPPPYKTFY